VSWDGESLAFLGFVSEAVQAIGESPEPEQATRLFCEAAVPRLADAAAVYLDGGAQHRVDPDGRLPPQWTGEGGRTPELVDERLIVVPLRAYGRPVGSAVLARDRERSPFAEVDLLAARQLGVPAALSVFHGRLHRRQLETVMGRLRTAVQTLASLDLPAEQVLHSLDEVAQRLAAQTLTTCVYCVYDPVLRRCTIANAGHLPPVLVRADGKAEVLTPPRCPPIGLGRTPFETMEIAADDDSMLVLYTDGLVEERGEDIGRSVDTLCRKLSTGAPMEELCDSVLPPARSDDVTLLAIKFKGIPSNDVAPWLVAAQPMTPGRVRRLVRRTLAMWGLEPMIPVAQLLTSELVTNAVRQTSRPITIRLMRTDVLLCEVSDDDHRMPIMREPGALDEDGRGLYLVSQLAGRWGTSRVAGGKTVWFSLPIPDGRSR
jgi:hypothetical protein